MSEMTMQEKIAQAINECDDGRVGFCERAAVAVLNVLHEPDEVMRVAGCVADLENGGANGDYTVPEVWQAMIDAALNDTPPETSA